MGYKLILITIAGVQDYILDARKTKDFYNGSTQIIDFIDKIQDIINKKYESEILLPYKEKDFHNNLDISNYCISKIRSDDSNPELEINIRQTLKEELNIFDFPPLNVYIVATDLKNDYKSSYKNFYRRLEGLKNNRFKNLSLTDENIGNYEDDTDNCSVCGIRRSSKNNKEKLCYVCDKKRNFKRIEYNSIEDIAAEEWEEKVKSSSANNFLDDYKFKVSKQYDEKGCVANFYHMDYLVKNHKELVDDLKQLNELAESKASRYYALVKADIDDLGKHFSGKYLEEDFDLLDFQQKLSKNILNFGVKVKKNIDEINEYDNEYDNERRKYIYSGGDDILFFAPLNKVFEFLSYVDTDLEKLNCQMSKENYKKKLTISRSIVIAHSTIPLRKIIFISKETLEAVKNKYKYRNKNGFSMTLIDSSANIKISYLKYNEETRELIIYLINKLKNNISRTFIYDLEKEISLFGENMSFTEYEIIRDIINNSINSICDKKKIDCETKETIRELFSEFISSNSTDYSIDINGYFNLLKIIDKYSSEIINELKIIEKEGKNGIVK